MPVSFCLGKTSLYHLSQPGCLPDYIVRTTKTKKDLSPLMLRQRPLSPNPRSRSDQFKMRLPRVRKKGWVQYWMLKTGKKKSDRLSTVTIANNNLWHLLLHFDLGKKKGWRNKSHFPWPSFCVLTPPWDEVLLKGGHLHILQEGEGGTRHRWRNWKIRSKPFFFGRANFARAQFYPLAMF